MSPGKVFKAVPKLSHLFVHRLVDMFSPPTSSKQLQELKDLLNKYNRLLVTAKLTNNELADLPLPGSLQPSSSTPLPTRFSTLTLLIKDTISCAVRLPFFLVPMIIHLPIYVMARMGANIVKEEMETQAQMKVAFGLLFSLAVYPFFFFVLWIFLGFTSLGALIAAVLVYGFSVSHKSLVDENYTQCVFTLSRILHTHADIHFAVNSFKRLVAAWRVIVGVWAPKRREMPLTKLASLLPASSAPEGATKDAYAWKKRGTEQEVKEADIAKTARRKRIPTRRFIRHVLRTRVAAARALDDFLAELEEGDYRINARPWLVEAAPYGGEAAQAEQQSMADEGKDAVDRLPMGTRAGSEVVEFLRQRGAHIVHSSTAEGGWGALSGDETEARSGDEGFEER
jgi:glycerol-3-phosphate O-acyltransferase/dihydroxyacetone phosphate acyltransferase